MKKILALAFILPCLAGWSDAQNLNYAGVIPTFSQTGRIKDRLNYNFFISETIDLFDETIGNKFYPASNLQLYIQPSIIYAYSPNLNFAGSLTYNYQKNNPDVPFRYEFRPWEQAVYGHNIAHARMTHRLRYEQRFIKNANNDDWPLSTRLRYQIGFNIPLNGKTLEDNEFYFNCYNEIYYTATVPDEKNRTAYFTEDWAYFGFGYQLPNRGRLEIGPLAQFNVISKNKDLRNLFLLQIAWITNFNFGR